MSIAEELAVETSWGRRIVSLAIALVVLAGGAFGAWYVLVREDSGAVVSTTRQEATVTTGSLVSSLTTTGTAASTLTSKLTFQSSGQVKSISVGVGAQVKAGQELARLDDAAAQRKIQTAAANLNTAKLKLQQLTDPPKASDVASAQQSIASARGQLANAQSNLAKATGGPSSTDIDAADAAVLQAQNGLQSATNNLNTSWANLGAAQRNYCNTTFPTTDPPMPCQVTDLPLGESVITALTDMVRNLGGKPAEVSTAISMANALLSANASYVSAKGSLASAQKSLDSAVAKRKALNDPPDALTLAQLEAAVDGATASLAGAEARYTTLMAGPTSTDLALQQQQVQLAEINYQQALEDANGLVLKAPFDGVIGAVGINVGDQVGAATAAMTLTNPEGVRIDLTVSETDLRGLKAGQFGIATFDALQNQTYLVKLTSVGTTPTVTQGVVTYPVQAQILRAADLAQNAAELQKVASALTSLGGGAAAQRGLQAGQSGTPGALQTRVANATPGAQRTPAAGITPGQGGFAGGGQSTGAGAAGLAALIGASMPTPGMNASVILVLDFKENVLLVPSTAIRRQGRTQVVNLLKADGTTEQRTVTVGGTDSSNTEITSGLSEGDKVVVGSVSSNSRTPTVAAGFAGGPVITGSGPGGDTGGVR